MVFDRKYFLKGILIAVLTALFLTAIIFFAVKPSVARADEDDNANVFLPLKSEEYYALNSPINAYTDNEITAIITNDNKLILSKADSIAEIAFANEDGLSGQIARFGNYLIYRNSQTLYCVKINDTDNRSKLMFTKSDSTQDDVTCNSHFYYENGGAPMLAACVEHKLRLYHVSATSDGTPILTSVEYFINNPLTIADHSPLALNDTSVFYLDADNKLCKIRLSSLNSNERYSTDVIPTSSLIANDEYLFYVSGTKIYKLAINDLNAVPQELSFSEKTYNLGAINNPKGLSFKGNNLLITNYAENGSIQEFKVNGTSLEFTGYAIASGLSAYNRVASTATDIEKYGNFVAALDGKKLTVIDTEKCADYNKEGFINKYVNAAPTMFALGKDTVMAYNGITISLDCISSNESIKIQTDFSNVRDISYQSGKYYLLFSDEKDSFVVIVDENDGKILNTVKFIDKNKKIVANIVAADVLGNVYIADETKIYKNSSDDAFDFNNAEKLCTDLAGNLFVLGDGIIHKLIDETSKTFEVAFETSLGNIKTFALTFDRSEVFFLIEAKEEVYCATNIGNVSLNDVKPNETFNKAMTKKNDLTLYTAKDGANVYSVKKDGADFTFNGLATLSAEYILVTKINVDENLIMYALASENGFVLVNEKDLTQKTVETADAPLKAYVTTSVYAYAIPIIEKNNSFTIHDGDKITRINKGTVIEIKNGLNVQGKTFYDASVTVDGETIDCYIPADFTADVLAETIAYTDYTSEKVKQTILYKNSDLTVELFELKEGDSVKILERDNGVLKVIATDENGVEVVGFIAENALAENPNTTVRNILIVLAVFASLAGTVSFFLLRKKTLI